VVGEAAARLIVASIEALPERVRVEHEDWVQDFLVEQAATLDVDALRVLARRIAVTLDPDGLLADVAYRERRRDLRLSVRADGSARLEAELTAQAAEQLRTVLDTLARPLPETDGARDPRTPGQRRHDGLLDALRLLHRADLLPACAGVSTTVILTLTAQEWAGGRGSAMTGHGSVIPAAEARRWAGGEARVLAVVLDRAKRVLAYSSTHRIFTEGQRLAMIARDQGCSFPGCDAPPHWCQAHHVTEHAAGGPTSIDNGALLCGPHHREHTRMGWTGSMINGVPHWTPPPWIDPHRVPRRNHTHHPTPSPA
jgi:hypothetical protein